MARADRDPVSGYVVLGLALMGAGGLALLSFLIAGAPIFLLGLAVLVLGRRSATVAWPALAGIAAAAVAFIAATTGGCTTRVPAAGSPPGTTTCTALGVHVDSETAALLLALAAALAAGSVGALAGRLAVGRRLRRRTG